MKIPENIIISRTDSIGDIILALPVAGVLKKYFPGIKIALMGKEYTKEMVMASGHIDEFIDVNDFLRKQIFINNKKPAAIIHLLTNKIIAKRAAQLKIPLRIGTTGRIYHWFTCNKLVRLSRNRSHLHEAQLNLKLLKPFGINTSFSFEDISGLYALTRLQPLSGKYSGLLEKDKYNIIIHPKSQGNAREWPADHFIQLINLLDAAAYNIFISGVEKEKEYVRQIIKKINKPVTDIAGIIPLGQFISFIAQCDGVVANSTGPLHIAAALAKDAIGIYPPLKPKHPGRWGPIGVKTIVFVLNKNCTDCKKNKDHCSCINAIQALEVKAALDKCMLDKKDNILIS